MSGRRGEAAQSPRSPSPSAPPVSRPRRMRVRNELEDNQVRHIYYGSDPRLDKRPNFDLFFGELNPTPHLDAGAAPPKQTALAVAIEQPLENLANNLHYTLESGEMTDITIKCGSQEFKTHMFMLSARSPVFKAMFQHDTMERQSREVNIIDIEPDTFRTLLEFIYSAKVEPEAMEFPKLCQLTAAADKYAIADLKSICFKYLARKINLKNMADIAILAHRHSPPEEIRKKVFDYCAGNFETLRREPEFKEVMKECLDEFFIPPPPK